MSESSDIIWLQASIPWNIRISKWKGRVAVTKAEEVFLPAALFMDESVALISVCADGAPLIQDEGHLWVLAAWLKDELHEPQKTKVHQLEQAVLNGLRKKCVNWPTAEEEYTAILSSW